MSILDERTRCSGGCLRESQSAIGMIGVTRLLCYPHCALQHTNWLEEKRSPHGLGKTMADGKEDWLRWLCSGSVASWAGEKPLLVQTRRLLVTGQVPTWVSTSNVKLGASSV